MAIVFRDSEQIFISFEIVSPSTPFISCHAYKYLKTFALGDIVIPNTTICLAFRAAPNILQAYFSFSAEKTEYTINKYKQMYFFQNTSDTLLCLLHGRTDYTGWYSPYFKGHSLFQFWSSQTSQLCWANYIDEYIKILKSNWKPKPKKPISQ